nr:hypothetical protein [Rhizobium sp. ACO-34A]
MPHPHNAATGTSKQAEARAGSLAPAASRSSLRAFSSSDKNHIDPKKADLLQLNIGSGRGDAHVIPTQGVIGQALSGWFRSSDVNRFRDCPIRSTIFRQFSRISTLTIHGLPA